MYNNLITLSIFFILLSFSATAQKLTLEPSPQSQSLELGNRAWYFVYVTNDTKKPLGLFGSPQKEFKVAHYEYVVFCNNKEIMRRTTSSLDTNEKFEDFRISTLPIGERKLMLGLREFPMKETGTYRIEFSYTQDPANVDNRYAKNGKAKKAVKSVTPFSAKTVHEFVVE